MGARPGASEMCIRDGLCSGPLGGIAESDALKQLIPLGKPQPLQIISGLRRFHKSPRSA